MAVSLSLARLLLVLACAQLIQADLVRHTLVVEEWVVDFLRPTVDRPHPAERRQPFKIPDEQRKDAYLVNGQYPGTTIECFEGDQVEILVVNKLLSEAIAIHWHGVHMLDTPWFDGARGITQDPILPNTNMTYVFEAHPAGTHYYHAHMDAVQSAKGIKGPFIIKKRDDPFKSLYQEEKLVVISDEWRQPEVCLKLEGAMAGNDVCADVRQAGFNGAYGNGTAEYPYPIIEVEHKKCYRLRYIFMGSNTENFVVTMSGHNMTLLALDGNDVTPIQVSSFNLHLGERVDVAICADQAPGTYLINATYDYACTLTEGHFIPPGFSPVPACSFFAFLKYKGHNEEPRGYPPVIGTGGGRNPKEVAGVRFDLTEASSWKYTKPLVPEPELPEPDMRYTINMGLVGPIYDKPTDEPLTMGRWYMDLENQYRPWVQPQVPLYRSKGLYGVNQDLPIIHVPENASVIEIVFNNLSPAAHVVHLHGMTFKVINYADFEWCRLNRTACFVMPHWLNPCPEEDRKVGDPNHPNIELGGYWGCAYNARKDRPQQNLESPLVKDMLQVWQRSWAVIRIRVDNPGWWMLHCHMEQHIPLGMQMVLDVLPSKQPPIPSNFPRIFSEQEYSRLMMENEQLKRRAMGN